jgi:hypothetical protein
MIDMGAWQSAQINFGLGTSGNLAIEIFSTHCTIFNIRLALPCKKP